MTAARIRGDLSKIYSHKLAGVIFVNPNCRISDVISAGIAQRQSAALQALVTAGILAEVKSGHENLDINPMLLDRLTGDCHNEPPSIRSPYRLCRCLD